MVYPKIDGVQYMSNDAWDTYISNALDRVPPELHSHLSNHGVRNGILDGGQFYLKF